MCRKKIMVSHKANEVRQELLKEGYYTTDSVVRATTMYAMKRDYMIISQDDIAIAIPAEYFEEIAALAADMADNRERGLI